MTTASTLAITPEIVREHGLTPDEYEKIKQLLGGREPTITGAWHLQRDVEQSIAPKQVFARAFETPAYPQPARRARSGREIAGIIDIGDGWACCAFKNRGIAQSSFVHRAIPGRSDRGRRNPGARHFHHGRKAGSNHGFPALRPHQKSTWRRPPPVSSPAEQSSAAGSIQRSEPTQAEIHKNHSVLEGVVSGIASLRKLFWRA